MKKFLFAFVMLVLAPLFAFALQLIDINTASVDQLKALPGVGQVTAEAIVAARPFKSVDELKNVKGIGDAKMAKLKPMVTVGGPALVNINTATPEQLAALPGIGPAKAKEIVAARPFKTVDDLKKVKGIKDAVLAKLRPYVTAN